jgi:hypothetical protein
MVKWKGCGSKRSWPAMPRHAEFNDENRRTEGTRPKFNRRIDHQMFVNSMSEVFQLIVIGRPLPNTGMISSWLLNF